jgi:hypothetical protein
MRDGVSLFDKLNFDEHTRRLSAAEETKLQFLV